MILTPRDDDVLCGQTKECLSHPGSRYFKQVISRMIHSYLDAEPRGDKMKVTQAILEHMVGNGRRFLKRNPETKLWEALDKTAIRDKIGHAIRFAADGARAKNKKKQETSGTSTVQQKSAKRSPKKPSRVGTSPEATKSATPVQPASPPASPVCVSLFDESGAPPLQATASSNNPALPILPNLSSHPGTGTDASTVTAVGETADISWLLQFPIIIELNPLDEDKHFAPLGDPPINV